MSAAAPSGKRAARASPTAIQIQGVAGVRGPRALHGPGKRSRASRCAADGKRDHNVGGEYLTTRGARFAPLTQTLG